MQFKEFISESFNKEYAYRVKLAADCGSDHMTTIEQCLAKYKLVSAAPFKRSPIEENPMEFVRAKGTRLISEVCSTDIVLKYPVNPRILEVWLAVNLNLDHERVLCYGVKEPRRIEADAVAERVTNDEDRSVTEEDAVLNNEDQEHYALEVGEVSDYGFGEDFNKKFLDELQKIKGEKGADYFRNYPTKDEIMGDNLRPMYDSLMNTPNQGQGAEHSKHVDVVSQSARRN
jgi:hypothetical protein|tara:strand:- start:14599 stop:15288 length:690 start_codon:yes stop_codon:yes gene_type:complete